MQQKGVRTIIALLVACGAILAIDARADDDFDAIQQKAVTAAVERVTPSVVRIETVGGLERVERVLIGTGPTTGLIVDSQGYIVSSAFNFVNKPASILVRLPDGTRKAARLVATDESRKLVLLKIDVDRPLPTPEIAPEAQMRVGQWCIAVGRTFEDDRPNLSVGILSALNRIWGKAIQTDAAVSPNNYGGPLVDIQGRVLGILAPMSPQSSEEIAGIEWYDSGIGFAVPLESLMKMLPRLRQGEDLHPGVAGFHLQAKNLYTGETRLAACRPGSPADKAGFKAGDRIVEIDGRKVTRAAEVKQEISRRYAGQKVRFVALRDGKRIEHDVELVAKLEPYKHGFLGILPRRDTPSRPGVAVRYVYPGSPAAEAKIEPGDVVVGLAGKPVTDSSELLHQIAAWEPGQEVEIDLRRGDQARKAKVKLGTLPEDLPPSQLPPAHGDEKAEADGPKLGVISLRVPEYKNEAWAYVPERYRDDVGCGVLVWLHGSAAPDKNALVSEWKSLCDSHDLILVVPKAADADGWRSDEAVYIESLLRKIESDYTIDPSRVVALGRESGASLAYLSAFRNRERIRAVAAVDAASILPPPASDPGHRLAVYVATAKNSRQAPFIAIALRRLREAGVPVTEKSLGLEPRDLKPEERAELVRWIDMLDRI